MKKKIIFAIFVVLFLMVRVNASEITITSVSDVNTNLKKGNIDEIDWNSYLELDFRSKKIFNGKNDEINKYYPRIKKIKDYYILTYHGIKNGGKNGASIYYSLSKDLINWTEPKVIWRPFSYYNSEHQIFDRVVFSNCDVLPLNNDKNVNELLVYAIYHSKSYYSTYTDVSGIVTKKCKVENDILKCDEGTKIDEYDTKNNPLKDSNNNAVKYDIGEIIHKGPSWEPHTFYDNEGNIVMNFTYAEPKSAIDGFNHSATGVGTLVSNDNGKTWSKAKFSAYYYIGTFDTGQKIADDETLKFKSENTKKANFYTTQMPVTKLLNDGRYFSVYEMWRPSDNLYNINKLNIPNIPEGYSISGSIYSSDYKFTNSSTIDISNSIKNSENNDTSIKDEREKKTYSGDVKEFFTIAKNRAAAPYIIQFPSGEVVVSYNSPNENGTNQQYLKLLTSVNGSQTNYIKTFSYGFWGSIELKSNNSLITSLPYKNDAISYATVYLNNTKEINSKTVTIDGNNDDWKSVDDALFIGSDSQAQSIIRFSQDEKNLYILAERLDYDVQNDDSLDLRLSINDSIYYLNLKRTSVELKNNQNLPIAVDSSIKEIKNDGIIYEIAINRKSISYTNNTKSILVYGALKNKDSGKKLITDTISKTNENSIETWIKFKNNDYKKEKEDVYDVVLFVGQSNMVGINYKYYDTNITDDVGYEYLYGDDSLVPIKSRMNNGEYLVYSNKVLSKVDNADNCPKDNNNKKRCSLEKSNGSTIIPAFAKKYYELTGHKIIAIHAANGGEKISSFLPNSADGQNIYYALVEKYIKAIDKINKMGYKIDKKFYIMFQGESDVSTYLIGKSKNYNEESLNKIASNYENNYKQFHFCLTGEKKDGDNFSSLSCNLDKNLLDFGSIVETSYKLIKDSDYDYPAGVEAIHKKQESLINDYDKIILASPIPYQIYINGQNKIDKNKTHGNECIEDPNKNEYCIYAKDYTRVVYKDNIFVKYDSIHFNVDSLKCIGEDSAIYIYYQLNKRVIPVNQTISFEIPKNIVVGDEYQFKIKEQSSCLKCVRWHSFNKNDDKEIGLIDSNGLLKANKDGKFKITAENINGARNSTVITVKKENDNNTIIKSISINNPPKKMFNGDTFNIKLNISPSNADSEIFFYKSSDENVLKVDENGKVEAVGKGKAKITVITSNNKTASSEIEVKNYDIKLNKKSISGYEGKTQEITATVENKQNIDSQNVKWSVSSTYNASIKAIEKSGNTYKAVITFLKAGSTNVKFTIDGESVDINAKINKIINDSSLQCPTFNYDTSNNNNIKIVINPSSSTKSYDIDVSNNYKTGSNAKWVNFSTNINGKQTYSIPYSKAQARLTIYDNNGKTRYCYTAPFDIEGKKKSNITVTKTNSLVCPKIDVVKSKVNYISGAKSFDLNYDGKGIITTGIDNITLKVNAVNGKKYQYVWLANTNDVTYNISSKSSWNMIKGFNNSDTFILKPSTSTYDKSQGLVLVLNDKGDYQPCYTNRFSALQLEKKYTIHNTTDVYVENGYSYNTNDEMIKFLKDKNIISLASNIFLLKRDTYNKIKNSETSCGSTEISKLAIFSPDGEKYCSKDYSKFVLLHQLGHMMDSMYYKRKGIYLSNANNYPLIKSKYSKILNNNKYTYLRDYSYQSNFEFYADLYAINYINNSNYNNSYKNKWLVDDILKARIEQSNKYFSTYQVVWKSYKNTYRNVK